jgi:glycosyltransferase involved in cell wall biosynthesis
MQLDVSVVIPAYNAARFIAMAIDSALSQASPPKEILVVDDGSNDNTQAIVSQYEKKVRYLYQPNAGPAAARNLGVREAKGEWIAFLDSDDYWDTNHLEHLMRCAEVQKEAMLIYCGKKWVDHEGRNIRDFPRQTRFPAGWIFSDMFIENYISSTSVVLVKRSIVLDVGGFNKKLRNAEDYDLWLRIAAIAPIYGVPIYTVNYRRHDGNLTLQTLAVIKGHIAALKNALIMINGKMIDSRNNPDRIDTRKIMTQKYNDAAIGMFYLGEYRELRLLGINALKKRYVSFPMLLRWLLSLLPRKILVNMKTIYRSIR